MFSLMDMHRITLQALAHTPRGRTHTLSLSLTSTPPTHAYMYMHTRTIYLSPTFTHISTCTHAHTHSLSYKHTAGQREIILLQSSNRQNSTGPPSRAPFQRTSRQVQKREVSE